MSEVLKSWQFGELFSLESGGSQLVTEGVMGLAYGREYREYTRGQTS